jgi:tetratricopeptide (TPR) repeat protein
MDGYKEAVGIWRTMDNPSELANALYNYSFSFTVPDQVPLEVAARDAAPEGRRILHQALEIFRAIGDERGEANVLWGLGNMQYFMDEIDPGSVDMALALEKFRKVGDRTMVAWTLHMLGGAKLRKGMLDEARADLREALRSFYEASDTAGVTLTLDDLSAQAIAEDDPERAARLWGAARNLAATTGATLASVVDEAIESNARPNVRTALGPDELDRLAREGAAMSLDEIVEYALDVSGDSLRDASRTVKA